MKEINMKTASAEKLTAAIKAAEGRATARCITPAMISNALEAVEKRLGIMKKRMEGVKVEIDCNAQDFPKAYKYTPESTFFEATYRGGSWRITDIYRYRTRRASAGYSVTLTDTAKAAIIEAHERW